MTTEQRDIIFKLNECEHRVVVQLHGNTCVAHCVECGWVGHKHRWIFCPSTYAYYRAQSEGHSHAHAG